MTGGRKCCKKGGILIVGVKLTPSSREVLTWTLAKFTDPGDRVIALHVTPSSAQPDVSRSKLDTPNEQVTGIFDSVIGVYEGFCHIKQINLQVKVADGPSVRKTLVQEANACGATKLVLGSSSKQLTLGPSFALAKFCHKQLPPTCTVLVIQHGRVVFERKGAQLTLGGETFSVLNTLQQTMWTKSCKRSGHCSQNKNGTPEGPFKAKLQTLQGQCPHSDFTDSQWFPELGFLNSPVSVLHAYKYVPPRLEGLRSCLPKRSAVCPLCTLGSAYKDGECTHPTSDSESFENSSATSQRDDEDIMSNCGELGCDQQSLSKAECSASSLLNASSISHKFGKLPAVVDIALESRESLCKEEHKTYLKAGSSQEEGCGELTGSLISQEATKELYIPGKKAASGPGWPLLHRSISMSKVINTKSHRLSVVEWALQLPDRHKELCKWLDDTTKDDSNSFSSSTSVTCDLKHECTDGVPLSHPFIEPKHIPHTPVVINNECSQMTPPQSNIHDQCQLYNKSSLALRVDSFCKNKSCKRFSFEELDAATCSFSQGKGGCSMVYKGELSDGQVVAVKCLNTFVPDAEQELLTEVEIISCLRHQHIVTLIGYCVNSQAYLLIYNFMSKGNLEQSLHGVKDKLELPWEVRQKVAIGVAEALDYLHDGCPQPVIHRDVKSSNILLSSDFEPQLADFGLAKWAPTASTHVMCNDVVGTFGYLAPEYFMYGKVNKKTDVYSFGVVLLELITGRQPIDTSKPKGQENLVMWARPLLGHDNALELADPQLEGVYDLTQMKNMMMAAALCLWQSPRCRPCMSQVAKLLRDKGEELSNWARQELMMLKEVDEGYNRTDYGDCDIHAHLTLALLGLDDDDASQSSTEQIIELSHSKCQEGYLGGH